MTMAADQRKRRLSSTSSAFSYGFQDQIRAKKRDLKLPNCDFSLNTHVSLKWDDNCKRVVAKDDQIGISWRHLSPFVGSIPCSSKTKLADVVTVPRDVFELNDLGEVLSYEVWQSVLTEKERKFLTQFLPFGVEADEAVRALCSGDNFHFGNPLYKWGSSVCSGDCHPDAVLQHEKSFKINKRAYYSELRLYHDNMIRNLQNLKQTCAGSKDPEVEIRQIVSSRSKRHEKTNFLDGNGHKYHKPDENVASMSNTLSPVADEKMYYSDNQQLSVIRDAEFYKRMCDQDHTKEKHEESITPPNVVKALPRPKKADKLQKPILIPNDGAKYMSYVKISKKQHELVKSMRQSGSSFQSRALNRLLGGLDSSNVKPYEMFVEEEQKKMHEYWLNLANKDIPNAFRTWRTLQLVKQKLMDSLWKEMEVNLRDLSKDKANQHEEAAQPALAYNKDDGKSSHWASVDCRDDDLAIQDSSSDTAETSNLCTSKSESPLVNPPNVNEEVIDPSSSMEIRPLQNPSPTVNRVFDSPSPMKESNQCIPNSESPWLNRPNVNEEVLDPSSSMEIRPLLNPSPNVNKEFDPPSPTKESNLCTSKSEFPLVNCSNVNEEVIDPSPSMESRPLQNPSPNDNKEFDPPSPMKESNLCTPKSESPLVNHPNVNEEVIDPSSSMEICPLQNLSLNVDKEFDPTFSIEKQSLQSPLISIKEQFDTSMSMADESLHHPPLSVKEELESVQHTLEVSEGFNLFSMKNKSLVEDNPLDRKEFIPMDLNDEDIVVTSEANDTRSLPEQHIKQTSEIPPSISHFSACLFATDPDAAKISGSSSIKSMWSRSGLPESYHSHPITLHTDSGGLFLRHPQVATSQPAQLIDLESDMPEEYATKDLLNRHASHLPLFNTYPPNGDSSELLHSLIKRDNYQEQQKKPGEFHPANALLESANQFPTHLHEHLQQPHFAVDNRRQKAQSELYIHPNTQDGVYSGNNRYSVQAPDNFRPLNARNWGNTHLSNPMQPSQLNSGESVNHNCFATNENRSHGGWSSSDSTVFPGQSMGSGSSTNDQSLFSVLNYHSMRPQSPYSPVGSTEHMIPLPPVNYGIPMTSNALLPPVSPFDYLSGGESSSSTLKNPNLGLMSLGHQPSGLQDPSGKPFLKSWNQ